MPARRLFPLVLAVCLAVPALAMAQTGLGGPSSSSEAASAGDTRAGGCDEPCPGDTPEGDCSPGCDECTCCPGALQAFVQATAMPQEPPPVRVSSLSAPNSPAPGVRSRVFRPPRSALPSN